MRREDGRPAGDDRSLVARMAAGDRDALATLYDRHAPLLMSLGRKMLGTTADATDLLHDVFIEAWEHAGEYDPARAPVRTWLAVRLRSRALDRLSRARVRAALPLDDEAARAPARQPGWLESLDVHGALAQLPAEARTALELTYFFGFTAVEIATELDVPVGTVKSRRARGLELLERALREGASDDDSR